ncbi:MAG: hypothetical protein R2867_24355 [Caldilineaceae bacterium]
MAALSLDWRFTVSISALTLIYPWFCRAGGVFIITHALFGALAKVLRST